VATTEAPAAVAGADVDKLSGPAPAWAGSDDHSDNWALGRLVKLRCGCVRRSGRMLINQLGSVAAGRTRGLTRMLVGGDRLMAAIDGM